MGFLERLFGQQDRKQQEHQPETLFARDNLGTRLDTLSRAYAYYSECLAKKEVPPSIECLFNQETDALRALTSLSYIKQATDTNELVSTQPIYFGWYQNDGGTWVVLLSGKSFTHDLWLEAKENFVSLGGHIDASREPQEGTKKMTTGTGVEASSVTFVRQERQAGPYETVWTVQIYRAPSKAAAMAFLQTNPITDQLQRVFVETPQGTFAGDVAGIYEK